MKKFILLTDTYTYGEECKILINIKSIKSVIDTPNKFSTLTFKKDNKTILIKETTLEVKQLIFSKK